jgi:hypothetical protein
VFQLNLQEIISQKYLALGFTQGFLFSRRRHDDAIPDAPQSQLHHSVFIVQYSIFTPVIASAARQSQKYLAHQFIDGFMINTPIKFVTIFILVFSL